MDSTGFGVIGLNGVDIGTITGNELDGAHEVVEH
jgi:hypothetical protein